MLEHIAKGGNVGIQAGEVSDWICAVDLDSEEAVRLAPKFLPETLKSGKQGIASHWVYRSPRAGYLQFRNVDREMLIELKASENSRGHQFVVEPSIHPDKGPYRWMPAFNPALIAELPKDELEKRIRHLAAAVLIVRNFPPDGGHDYANSLCGYLLRNGMAYEDLEHILETCWPADKARHHNIAGAIRDTDAKLKRNNPVTGGRTLEELAPSLPKALAKALGWERVDNHDGQRYRCADTGNAERFAERHGGDLRYCFPFKTWFVYDSTRWRRDDTGHVVSLAKETARSIFEEAAKAENDERAKELGKWAIASQSLTRIQAMIELAKSEPGIPIRPDELDTDHYLFNCLNGTIDLRTGQLREHRRSDLITKIAPVEYRTDADGPRWQSTLDRVLPKPEIRTFFQRLCGYALSGDTSEHVLPMLYGTGANGKSTVLNALLEALGDYGMQAAPDLLIAKRNAHPTELADLFGARFVASIEVEDGRRLAESLVKQLTGGDRVKARRMRQDFWEFPPTHKVFMAINHKPEIRGTDAAIWRRIRLIPFTETIPPAEQDKKLPAKLREELSGILAWAVEGCLEWRRAGLQAPDEVRKATGQYRSEMDVIGAFLQDECEIGRDYRESFTSLYTRYEEWCEEGGEKAEARRKFNARLKERGQFEARRSGPQGSNEWHGLQLLKEKNSGFAGKLKQRSGKDYNLPENKHSRGDGGNSFSSSVTSVESPTAEQEREIQRSIDEGASERWAQREVLGEEHNG
jgi:putative DNA primase/helicase